jgi:hypothetical protein
MTDGSSVASCEVLLKLMLRALSFEEAFPSLEEMLKAYTA